MSTFDSSFALPITWRTLALVNEVRFKASLSGGKGGQNVNKVSTKVELYWNPSESTLLTDEQKQLVLNKLAKQISAEGELRLVCEEERSQLKNKELVIEKFYNLVASCFVVRKRRRATKPTKSSVAKRLNSKSIRKDIKQGRKKWKE